MSHFAHYPAIGFAQRPAPFAMLDVRMRLFVALDLEETIRQRIREFIELIRLFAPGVRWVAAESLHITLKFIGEQPDAKLKEIESALAKISATSFSLSVAGCGFFPTARTARVFWAGIEAEHKLAQLAADVELALEPLGIAREKRTFSPHLTLARSRGGSGAPGRQRQDKPNQNFAKVQEQLSKMGAIEFGAMTACGFFLYRSQLLSQGSRYTKLARFGLEKA